MVPERGDEQFPKIEQNPGKSPRAENSEVKGSIRVLEKKRCPTKQYDIDVMNVLAEEGEKTAEEA